MTHRPIYHGFFRCSTDEDARQAFTRNNGKIKEVQITLMLSSRTEMQRVIESARAQSYAAFMQPTPTPAAVPLPAVVPAVVPASFPDMKKEIQIKTEKKESRRRSRSKSRERKDRSRDRDRKEKRHRDRSRSRSRDRKDRRRRDRSRSRGRSRSRDRDRRSRDHKRSEERVAPPFQKDPRKPLPEVWATQNPAKDVIPVAPQPPSLLGTFPITLEQAKRTLGSMTAGLQQANGFQGNNDGNFAGGRSWPPGNFPNRSIDNFQGKRGNMAPGNQNNFNQNRFQRNNFQRNDGPRNNRVEDNFTGCCVALEPFYGSYNEVRRFFQGMLISHRGVKMINDASGRRTGIVYLQFTNRKSKEEALTLNGEDLNGITVSVTHLNDRDFEESEDRYTPGHSDNDNSYRPHRMKNITKYFNNAPAQEEIKEYTCLIVEDLPTYCKEQDILHIFSQHPIVALILTPKPRGGSVAYVKFSSKEVAKKAAEEKSHHVIGGKPVTVKPCKDEEFEEINKEHEVDLTGSKDEDIGTDCLSVSGLPPKTNDKDIADFFSDIGVIPTKIHLMSNNLGFTGQAYCEFISNEEAARAAKKNDTKLGSTHIDVKPIGRDEMMGVLGHTLPAPIASPELTGDSPAPQKKLPIVNPPAKQTLPSPMASPAPLGHHGGNDFMPQAPGMHPMNRPFYRNFENGPIRGPHRFGPRGGGGGPRPRFAPMADHFDDSPPPGCTVYMKNVPYKAGTNEILDFFADYNITNNVSRRYNPNNTPSDEAKVVFFNPDEAYRAVEELHHQKIWDRQIFLRQE